MTLLNLFQESISRYSDLPCVGWAEGSSWTYAEVAVRVARLQSSFRSWGLKEGDKVAIWSTNHPGWGVAYLALVTGSLVAVPILPDFTPAEVSNVVAHGEVTVLLVGKSHSNQTATLNGSFPKLRVVVLEDLLEELENAPSTETVYRAPAEDDLAALIYTSGTTGSPKGVMLTHRNIASNAVAMSTIPQFDPGEIILSVLPLAHTYECTVGFIVPFLRGVKVCYLPKPPSAAVLLPALAKVRPHALLVVPLFIEKIYRQKVLPGMNHGILGILRKIPGVGSFIEKLAGAKLQKTFGGRLKFFGIGGAPLAPEVEGFLHRVKFPYAVGYGLTETSPLISGDLKSSPFSAGPILKDVEVKIGEPRNADGEGEILVRGPNVMKGYYKEPAKTAEVLTPDGWFHTGDLGVFGGKNELFIKGRSKNLILGPSGENIYPEAIEALLNQRAHVVESLVLQRGTEIVAKVVLDADFVAKESHSRGHDLSGFVAEILAELRSEINVQVSRFSRLSFVEEQKTPFEKTATQKIKRYLYA